MVRVASLIAVINPGQGTAPPGVAGPVTMVISWVAWTVFALCVVGVLTVGGQARRRPSAGPRRRARPGPRLRARRRRAGRRRVRAHRGLGVTTIERPHLRVVEPAGRAPRRPSRRGALVVAAFALLLALLGWVFFTGLSPTRPPPTAPKTAARPVTVASSAQAGGERLPPVRP